MQLTRNQVYLPLCLCLVGGALYRAVSVQAIAYTAREAVFGGLCAALVWALVSFVLLQLGRILAEIPPCETCSNVATTAKVLLCFAMVFGMGQTAAQQLQFYAVQFGAGGGWLALFCVVACCLHATPHALVRCARVLLWLCVAAALCAALGLAAQSDLQRLATTPLTTAGVGAAFWVGIGCYPEYFLLMICQFVKHEKEKTLCGKEGAPQQKACKKCGHMQEEAPLLLLPLAPFGVQCAAVLCTELLFGVQGAEVGGFEFLRSWALLNFSRYDGVVALLWLLLAFFRLRVFAFAAVQVWPFGLHKTGDVPL